MLGISCNRIVMRQQYEADRYMEFCPQRALLEATDDVAQILLVACQTLDFHCLEFRQDESSYCSTKIYA